MPFSQTDSANDLYCSNHFLDQILKKRKEKRAGRVLKPARGRHGSNMKRSYLYPSVLQRCALFLLFRCAFALITRQRDEVQHEDFRSNSAENTRVVQAVQSPRGSQEQVVISLNHFRHTHRGFHRSVTQQGLLTGARLPHFWCSCLKTACVDGFKS